MATWLIFGSILFARVSFGWCGRKAAWLTIGAAILVLIGFFGLTLCDKTKHQDMQLQTVKTATSVQIKFREPK